MDFQFKVNTSDDSCDPSNDENEYHMEIQFTSLKFRDETIANAKIIFLYGDLMNMTDVHRIQQENNNEDDDETTINNNNEFEIEKRTYVIHSTPSRLAEKMLDVPIIFLFMDKDEQMIGNPIILEVNECFANSIRCNDFKEETLRKEYDIADDSNCLGKVSLTLSIIRDFGNSNRFRKFYTESTDERLKLEAIE